LHRAQAVCIALGLVLAGCFSAVHVVPSSLVIKQNSLQLPHLLNRFFKRKQVIRCSLLSVCLYILQSYIQPIRSSNGTQRAIVIPTSIAPKYIVAVTQLTLRRHAFLC